MNPNDAFDIAQQAVWVTIKLGAPVMLLALVVGLLVSFLQALTQIQEMTLTFVPKMLVIMLSLLIFLPFMVSTLTSFTQELFARIVSG